MPEEADTMEEKNAMEEVKADGQAADVEEKSEADKLAGAEEKADAVEEAEADELAVDAGGSGCRGEEGHHEADVVEEAETDKLVGADEKEDSGGGRRQREGRYHGGEGCLGGEGRCG